MKRVSVAGPAPAPGTDGLGQGLIHDVLWFLRFWRCRCHAIPWRVPADADESRINSRPRLARFGDDTVAVADWEGRSWIVRQSDFFGWPDGPRYTLFVLEGDAVWMAWGFYTWPATWGTPLG